MKITEQMIEAGAKAIAPDVWDVDPAVFGHPDSLNRKGHEHCKDMVRKQARVCLEAALHGNQYTIGSNMTDDEEKLKFFMDAALIQAVVPTGRHDCPCEDGKCIYPECTCVLNTRAT